MKNASLSTKLVTAFVFIAVMAYFGIQAWRYFVDPETMTLVYTYRAEHTLTLNGFVVRDESVVDCADTLVELMRTEGERVAAGKPIATVYQSTQALQSAQELSALREQLSQLEYAQTAARDTEAALRLDADIEDGIVSLRTALLSENYASLDSGVSALKATVLRREFAYRGASGLSERIASLNERIASAAGAVGGASRVITAPYAGTYSAVADGYEAVLTPEALRTLTPSAFARITPDAVSGTAGKLIRGEIWYYAALVDEADARALSQKRSYQLAIPGGSLTLPVTIDHISHAQNGRCLLVLSSDEYLSHVTMLRAQSAELILDAYTGLRIPKNALRIGEDGQTGVYCLIGRQSYFKPVDILYQGEDYCLVAPGEIRAARESDYVLFTLRAGDEVIVSARELYNGKVID